MHFMTKQFATRIFFSIILLTLLSSCSGDSNSTPDDATFTDNVYKNNFFNFQITLPDAWHSASQEAMNAMSEAGKDMIAGEDKNLSAGLKAAPQNEFHLFQTFQVAPGTPTDYFNSNITCVAENVGHFPGITTGKDYLLNVEKLLGSGQIDITFGEEIQKHDIDGKDFYQLDTTVDMLGHKIEQKYYAMYHDGFILTFVMSFSGNDQEKTIQEAMDSITFQ